MKSLKKFGIMTGIVIVVVIVAFVIYAISFEMEKQANGGFVEVIPMPMIIALFTIVISVFIWAVATIVMVVSYVVKKIKNAK